MERVWGCRLSCSVLISKINSINVKITKFSYPHTPSSLYHIIFKLGREGKVLGSWPLLTKRKRWDNFENTYFRAWRITNHSMYYCIMTYATLIFTTSDRVNGSWGTKAPFYCKYSPYDRHTHSVKPYIHIYTYQSGLSQPLTRGYVVHPWFFTYTHYLDFVEWVSEGLSLCP